MTISGTNISYTRAALSCLPVIGLVAALDAQKVLKSHKQLKEQFYNELNSKAVKGLVSLEDRGVEDLTKTKLGWKLAGEFSKKKEQIIKTDASLIRAGRVYANCLTANSFLTLAAFISLLALGILGWLVAVMGVATVLAMGTGHVLYTSDLPQMSLDRSLFKKRDLPVLNMLKHEQISRKKSIQALDLHMARKPYQRPVAAYLDLAKVEVIDFRQPQPAH